MATRLYVGNLNYDTTEDELMKFFGQCGQVGSAKIVKDRDTGRSKGFGFVEMPDEFEARAAVDRLKGQDLNGRPVVVDEARDRPSKGPRR